MWLRPVVFWYSYFTRLKTQLWGWLHISGKLWARKDFWQLFYSFLFITYMLSASWCMLSVGPHWHKVWGDRCNMHGFSAPSKPEEWHGSTISRQTCPAPFTSSFHMIRKTKYVVYRVFWEENYFSHGTWALSKTGLACRPSFYLQLLLLNRLSYPHHWLHQGGSAAAADGSHLTKLTTHDNEDIKFVLSVNELSHELDVVWVCFLSIFLLAIYSACVAFLIASCVWVGTFILKAACAILPYKVKLLLRNQLISRKLGYLERRFSMLWDVEHISTGLTVGTSS